MDSDAEREVRDRGEGAAALMVTLLPLEALEQPVTLGLLGAQELSGASRHLRQRIRLLEFGVRLLCARPSEADLHRFVTAAVVKSFDGSTTLAR